MFSGLIAGLLMHAAILGAFVALGALGAATVVAVRAVRRATHPQRRPSHGHQG